jgi:GntR family transcriptional repressor for pyruvate dehydrogenase complex
VNSAKLEQGDPNVYIERVKRDPEDILNPITRQDPESARAAMRTFEQQPRTPAPRPRVD